MAAQIAADVVGRVYLEVGIDVGLTASAPEWCLNRYGGNSRAVRAQRHNPRTKRQIHFLGMNWQDACSDPEEVRTGIMIDIDVEETVSCRIGGSVDVESKLRVCGDDIGGRIDRSRNALRL